MRLFFYDTGEEYTSNSDPRWLEVGFQRGGPASDLRSSGLLGLYCLIYFVDNPTSEFQRILDRTRHGVSEGNMKNYPLAIACINVTAVLTETLGFGDAGTHSAGCSVNAMKTFVHLIGQTVARAPYERDRTASVTSTRALVSFDSWEEIVGEADNHVFEDIFCLLFPVLDVLFVEMGAVRLIANPQLKIVCIMDADDSGVYVCVYVGLHGVWAGRERLPPPHWRDF